MQAFGILLGKISSADVFWTSATTTVLLALATKTTMMLRLATARPSATTARRCLSMYTPTLTERRVGEAGTGGRNSEAGLKVALFGASGFLGEYVCAELGECR